LVIPDFLVKFNINTFTARNSVKSFYNQTYQYRLIYYLDSHWSVLSEAKYCFKNQLFFT
jgi:hypothetical protein